MDKRYIDLIHELQDCNTARNKAIAECDALRTEAAQIALILDGAIAERDALRAALVSLVDGKSEFDIEYDTGMDADEARRIIALAYNR